MSNIVRGAVFLAQLDSVRGSEQKGYRPVIIIQNNIGNKLSSTTIIVPISTQIQKNFPSHIHLNNFDFLDHNSIALIEQIRVIDKKRLRKYLGVLPDDLMKQINSAIGNELSINGNV